MPATTINNARRTWLLCQHITPCDETRDARSSTSTGCGSLAVLRYRSQVRIIRRCGLFADYTHYDRRLP